MPLYGVHVFVLLGSVWCTCLRAMRVMYGVVLYGVSLGFM